MSPVVVSDNLAYMPWGADNQMPYNVLDLIESDETLATCQLFNAEVCFGSDSAPKGRCCSNQGSDCGLSESRVVQLAEISLHCEFHPAVGRLFPGVASVGYRPIIRSSHFQELQEQPPAISSKHLKTFHYQQYLRDFYVIAVNDNIHNEAFISFHIFLRFRRSCVMFE